MKIVCVIYIGKKGRKRKFLLRYFKLNNYGVMVNYVNERVRFSVGGGISGDGRGYF